MKPVNVNSSNYRGIGNLSREECLERMNKDHETILHEILIILTLSIFVLICNLLLVPYGFVHSLNMSIWGFTFGVGWGTYVVVRDRKRKIQYRLNELDECVLKNGKVEE